MSGQIDRVGDDGGRGVGLRRGPRQHGDGVGDTEREAAAVTAAGRHPSRRVVSMDGHGPQQARRVRPVGKAHRKLRAISEMQRDVAAIVDVGARKLRVRRHRGEDFLGHRARDRRHRRDEAIGGERRHRVVHAARHLALQQAPRRVGGLAQQRQLGAEFVEQSGETPRRRGVGGADVCIAPARLDDQVDRTILQVKTPAVGKKLDLRRPRHRRGPGAGNETTWRVSVLSFTDASGRTWSIWPPSAA